jgi:hypothetical protein
MTSTKRVSDVAGDLLTATPGGGELDGGDTRWGALASPDFRHYALRRRAAITVLVAAFVSFLLSVTLWFTGNHEQGLFVGLWVPSILSFGLVALQLQGGRRG